MKKLTYCFICFVSSLWAFNASASQIINQTWTSFPFVEKAFFEVVLKSEFSKRTSPVLKWQKPIRYWVGHDVADDNLHNQLLNKHFQHISQITHLSIAQVNHRNDANMFIFFTKRTLWKKLIEKEMGKQSASNIYGSVCMFNIRSNKSTSEINKAVIIIPVDQAREHGKLVSCIIEETTQALGLKNDSEYAYPSIFNDKTPDAFLSPLDIVLLKLLYSSSIKPGMNKTMLKPVLKQQYTTMKRNGDIDRVLSESVHSPIRVYLGM